MNISPTYSDPTDHGDAHTTRGRSLDAFTIALKQACDGKWYTSTDQLQLASLSICTACRAVVTISRVRATERSPRSLWTASPASSLQSTADVGQDSRPASRVPPLRAYGVRWQLPASALLPRSKGGEGAGQAELFRSTVRLELQFTDSLDGMIWPVSLRWLTLANDDGSDLGEVILSAAEGGAGLPGTIQQLHVLGAIREPIPELAWLPASLKQLTFGGPFSQSIVGTVWPNSLQELLLGGDFNEPIAGVEWPGSLRRLTFGDNFDQPISGATWPPTLLELEFRGRFDRPIAGIAWPPALQHLTFSWKFNHPIREAGWPDSLERITFGGGFEQPVAGARWPASLCQVTFGEYFNQPLVGVTWPASLQDITFGRTFDQSLEGVVWPASLQKLTFGNGFSRLIDGVRWPASLRELTFGDLFSQRIGPSLGMLDTLTLGSFFDDTIDLPPSVTVNRWSTARLGR